MEVRKRRRPVIYKLTEVNGITLPVGGGDDILPPRGKRKLYTDEEEILHLRVEIATEVFAELLHDLNNSREVTAVELLRQLADMLERG